MYVSVLHNTESSVMYIYIYSIWSKSTHVKALARRRDAGYELACTEHARWWTTSRFDLCRLGPWQKKTQLQVLLITIRSTWNFKNMFLKIPQSIGYDWSCMLLVINSLYNREARSAVRCNHGNNWLVSHGHRARNWKVIFCENATSCGLEIKACKHTSAGVNPMQVHHVNPQQWNSYCLIKHKSLWVKVIM